MTSSMRLRGLPGRGPRPRGAPPRTLPGIGPPLAAPEVEGAYGVDHDNDADPPTGDHRPSYRLQLQSASTVLAVEHATHSAREKDGYPFWFPGETRDPTSFPFLAAAVDGEERSDRNRGFDRRGNRDRRAWRTATDPRPVDPPIADCRVKANRVEDSKPGRKERRVEAEDVPLQRRSEAFTRS